MDVTDGQLIEVSDDSQIGEARRKIRAAAIEHGLDQRCIDRLDLVSNELASNLIKHAAHGGRMIVQCLTRDTNLGVEIFALDAGPGMDYQACLVDGYSTVGTLGTGLGAVKRLTDSMEIGSTPGQGTFIQTRVWLNKTNELDRIIGGITIPITGESISGDKWNVSETESGLYCLLVDGLGHGFEAAEAAKIALAKFKENLSLTPAEMIHRMHRALIGTRGAVGAVARIEYEKQRVTYAGLGNIGAILSTNSEAKHLTSLNGTLGYEARKVTEFSSPWNRNSTLVMHSDGVSSRVGDGLEQANGSSASVIAASLYFRYAKSTDDATVLVAKHPHE